MRSIFLFFLAMMFVTDVTAAEDRGLVAWEGGDFKKAFEEWKSYADKGDSGAQYSIGLLFRDGKGVPKDEKRALLYFQKAAEQGHANAQLLVGAYAQDYKKAVYWFHKAANQGVVKAQDILAGYYLNGMGVQQSDLDAVTWYRKAAEQGYAPSQLALGQMFVLGRGVPQDFRLAAIWFRKAAEQGNADAQYALAYRLSMPKVPNLNDVSPDDEQAIFWLHKAASQGHAEAIFRLGWSYIKGFGVVKNKVVGLALADFANVSLNETPWVNTWTRKQNVAEMTTKELEDAGVLSQKMIGEGALEVANQYLNNLNR